MSYFLPEEATNNLKKINKSRFLDQDMNQAPPEDSLFG